MPSCTSTRIFWLGYWLCVIFFLLSGLVPQGAFYYLGWPYMAFFQAFGLAAALLAVGCLVVARDRPRSGSNPYAIALLVFLAGVAGSLFFTRFRATGGLASLVPVAAVSLGVISFHRVQGAEDPVASVTRLLRVLAVAGLLVCATGLGLWIRDHFASTIGPTGVLGEMLGVVLDAPGPWETRNRYPFGLPNYGAGFGLVVSVVAFTSAVVERSGGWRAAGILAGISGVALVLTSGSRAGTFGLVLAGGLAGGWWIGYARRVPMRWKAALWGGMILLLAGVMLAQPRLRANLERVAGGEWGRLDTGGRLEYVGTGLSIGKRYPLFGVGPGAAAFHYPLHWKGEGNAYHAQQLHSTPVQWWAEGGIVTLAGGVGLCIVLGMGWWRLTRIHRDGAGPDARRLAGGLGLALVAYAPVALTDYQLNVPAVAGLMGIVCGALAGLDRRLAIGTTTGGGDSRRHLLVAGGCGVLLLWYGVLHLGIARARSLEHGALLALAAGDQEVFFAGMEKAMRVAPSDPSIPNRMGYELAREVSTMREEPSRSRALLGRASEAFERSLRIWEGQEFAHTNLGMVFLALGDEKKALYHYRRAVELIPHTVNAYYGMATCWARLGNETAFKESLVLECLANPAFLTASLWYEEHEAARDDVLGMLRHQLRRLGAKSGPDKDLSSKAATLSALADWWWEGKVESLVFRETPVIGGWIARALDADAAPPEAGAGLLARRVPLVFLHEAWRRQDEKPEAWVDAAIYAATGQRATTEEREQVLDWLRAESRGGFAEWLREGIVFESVSRREEVFYRRGAHRQLQQNLTGGIPVSLMPFEYSYAARLATKSLLANSRGAISAADMRVLTDGIYARAGYVMPEEVK